MANIDIKNIIGQSAIDGINNTTQALLEANEALTKQIEIISNLNKQYQSIDSSIKLTQALTEQQKTNLQVQQERVKIEQENSKLEKAAIEAKTEEIKKSQEKLKVDQEAAKLDKQNIETKTAHIKKIQELKKLRQEQLKVQKLNTDLEIKERRESERLTRVKKKEAQEREKAAKKAAEEQREYKKLTKTLNENRAKAKDLAAQYGVNSKQFKAAQRDVNNLDKQIKKIDSSLGQHQRNVGNYFSDIVKGVGSVAAGFLTFNAVVKGAKALLETTFLGTQDNIDFFGEKLAGISARFNVLKDRVSNFGDSVVKAFNTDSPDSFFSKMVRIAKALDPARMVWKDLYAEMDKVSEEAEKLEKANNKLAEQYVGFITIQAELRKERELNRLYSKQEGLTDRERLEFLDKAIAAEQELMDNELAYNRERLRIETEKLDLSISTREDRKKVAEIEAELIALETKSIKQQRSMASERLSLVNKINAAERKDTKDTKDEVTKINTEGLNELKAIQAEMVDSELLANQYALSIDKKYMDEKAEYYKNKEAEITAQLQEQEQIRQQLKEFAIDQLSVISNKYYDSQIDALDKELDALQNNYSNRIAAAEGNTELQESLAREMAQKQYEIQLEQAKLQKRQSYTDILINTAVGVSKALAQGGLAGILQGAAITTAGLAQAAVVANTPLPTPPQFATGTESSPNTFIAGEKGRELMVTKDGKVMLTPNHATLYDGMAETKIYPNSQTEKIMQVLNLANAGVLTNDQTIQQLDAIEQAVKESKSTVTLDKHGVLMVARGNSNFVRKYNKRFRN